MSPYRKDVVNVSPPYVWSLCTLFQEFPLQLSHKYVGMKQSHPCTHRHSLYLQEMIFIKLEVTSCQNKRDQLPVTRHQEYPGTSNKRYYKTDLVYFDKK